MKPISEANAWRSADLGNKKSFTVELNDAARTELHHVAASMTVTDRAYHKVRKADVLMPTVDTAMGQVYEAVENGRGFALTERYFS